MTVDLALVLGLLLAAVVMFAVNRPRMDAVALLMIVALPLTGIVTTREALAGFADPSIVLIAAFFVIGDALVRTGVAQRLGDLLIARAGQSEARLIVLLMIMVAIIGSVMSSTGVVAIFIPIVLRVARNAAIAPARLLMPLSVAALISGMMTLVATAPNLVVQGELLRHGLEGFGFFAFSPFGVPVLAIAILYMLFARRLLARARPADPTGRRHRPRLAEWVADYALQAREYRLRVPAGSPLQGRVLRDLDLRASAGINIIAIERGQHFARRLIRPQAETLLESGDVLMLDVFRPLVTIDEIIARYGLERLPLTGRYFADRRQDIGLAEVMVPATSPLIGKTVVEARFRTRHDLAVIGLRHGRRALVEEVLHQRLASGDTLLVTGPWRAIRKLREDQGDLVVLALPVEMDDVLPAGDRAPFALAILALVIALMVSGLVANVVAALIGCLLLGLSRCIDMNAAYRAIHWQSLVLIVGMLPFSLALQKTGGIALAADGFIALFGDAGPRLALAALFVLTAGLGLFISNTATAVLMAPVALAIAGEMGLSPYPFAMTVALAASTAFITPVSSPVNTLVVGPGNYRFGDFVKVGAPLAVLTLIACVALVPLALPFSP